jgi:hypothetical protein
MLKQTSALPLKGKELIIYIAKYMARTPPPFISSYTQTA